MFRVLTIIIVHLTALRILLPVVCLLRLLERVSSRLIKSQMVNYWLNDKITLTTMR